MALLATATTLALTGIGIAPSSAGAFVPHFTADPTTGLHERSSVRIETEWWPEGQPPPEYDTLTLATCRDVPSPDLEVDCVVGASRTDVPIWSEFEVVGHEVDLERSDDVPVHRYLPLPSGLHDCRLSPCVLTLVHEDERSDLVPIAFGPEWAPWSSPAAFVDGVLAPLPRRPLATGERAALVADLQAGTTPARDLVLDLVREPRVDATVGEATRQYVAFFGRRPETGGLVYWADRLAGGLPPDKVARHFGASAEARATYAGMTPGQIVDRVYLTALERPAEPAGRAYWVQALADGLPLWKLVWHVARSAEMRGHWADETLATALHLGWRGTGPSETVWVMGGAMYSWIGLTDQGDGPGLP